MDEIINKRNSVSILKLNKNDIENYLEDMFEIISKNMEKIAPTGNSKTEDYTYWKQSMQREIENNDKRWIIALYNGDLIGYFLYKFINDTLFLDELQIKEEHHHDRTTFRKLFSSVLNEEVPENTIVYTCVNRQNDKSRAIINKFGFVECEKTQRGFRYKTKWQDLKRMLEDYPL